MRIAQKDLSKDIEGKEKRKLFSTKSSWNCQLKLKRSDNTEIFVVKFKYAAKMSLVSPPEYDK